MSRRWKSKGKPNLSHFARKAAKPFRRRTRPGASPGTLRVDPQAPPPVISVIAYGPGPDQIEDLTACGLDVLPDLLSRHRVTWVNVDGLGSAEVIERIGKIFDLHSLALEDVVHVHQRAKVEDYEDNLFVVARMAEWEVNGRREPSVVEPAPVEGANGAAAAEPVRDDSSPVDRRPVSEQVSLFLGRNYVVTFQEHAGSDSFEPVRTRLRRRRGKIRDQGADYLAYALLDSIIDGYFPVIEELGARLEQLDEDILARGGRDHLARLHRLRGDLLVLRKHLWPQREAIHELIRDPHPLVGEETYPFLRDCYDHTAQLLDVVETYREMCADLREYHYAQVSARTNEVVKVLTVISTIFIPLSFIAGIYGMNFDPDASPWNMPELRARYGYPAALAFMTAVGVGLFAWIRSKGWLRRDEA